MSMLQQIVESQYIDPDLLAELSEDQKQVLFCKIREEQVKKWEEHEKKLETKEKKDAKKPLRNKGSKQVDFLLAEDGNPWTWVMGEHSQDKSIEQILEEDTQDRARKQAEQEAEQLVKLQEEQLDKAFTQEQACIEEEKKKEEEEMAKKEAEAARKQATELARKVEEEKQQQAEEQIKRFKKLRERREFQRQTSIDNVHKLMEKRSSEIYMTFKEAQNRLSRMAEENSKQLNDAWMEQEKKSKVNETELRDIARHAREQHRKSRSLKTESQVISAILSLQPDTHDKNKPPIPKKPPRSGRLAKPPDRRAVVRWFRDTEEPNGVGVDPKAKTVLLWFHGMISRQDAEEILEEKPTGTFLVRVSEKVWGYAISYRGYGRCKHFLIDASTRGSYIFFGSNQITHKSLTDLVEFHKTHPISNIGQELLLHPCGQTKDTPDYGELFPGCIVESSYL